MDEAQRANLSLYGSQMVQELQKTWELNIRFIHDKFGDSEYFSSIIYSALTTFVGCASSPLTEEDFDKFMGGVLITREIANMNNEEKSD